ncbi:MAG: beta-N-acetylhexosaminidase [Bdellovibrionales bacterium]|nr:beta-N-acetylhexosaminidase [Bdellovibrionales bacterium]
MVELKIILQFFTRDLSSGENVKKQIGQHFIIGLKGKELLPEEARFIIDNNIGGVILFDRNLESVGQIQKLCSDIQNLRHKLPEKTPLFISVDMEGGRVARLKPPFTRWPAAAKLGTLDSTSVAFKFSQMMAEEMRCVGINLDYAPCVDVLTNPKNAVIGDRSISSDPEVVAKIASALARGFIKGGVIPCAKHFPGHGGTLIDSHDDLPIEEAQLSELMDVDLIPFKKTFRARLDMVMTAHIKFPHIDPDFPVTLSKIFIQEIMRGELKYRNLVISDDLGMKALTKHYDIKALPVLALQAGCDILLFCNDFDQQALSLEMTYKALAAKELDETHLNEAYSKIIALKQEKLSHPDPLPMSEVEKLVGHPDHLRLAKAVVEGSVPADLLGT